MANGSAARSRSASMGSAEKSVSTAMCALRGGAERMAIRGRAMHGVRCQRDGGRGRAWAMNVQSGIGSGVRSWGWSHGEV